MKFRCIYHKKAYEGKLTKNYNSKCFKCDGSGRKCLVGYNLFIQWLKNQDKEGDGIENVSGKADREL